MAFPNNIKLQRYKLANGRCECTRLSCRHLGRCRAFLPSPLASAATALDRLSGRLPAYSFLRFEFNHRNSVAAGGASTLANCEFLCEACHINTRTYGTNLTIQ